jgi:hypothetical protein
MLYGIDSARQNCSSLGPQRRRNAVISLSLLIFKAKFAAKGGNDKKYNSAGAAYAALQHLE